MPVKSLKTPVTLETIRADEVLKDLPLGRNSRLSATPVNEIQFKSLLALSDSRAGA